MKQLIQCISYYQTSKGLKVGHLSRLQKLKPISLSRPHWPHVRALGTLELPGDGFYAGFDFPVVHLGIPKNHINGFWVYLDKANFRFMSQLSNRSNIRKLRTKNCTQLGNPSSVLIPDLPLLFYDLNFFGLPRWTTGKSNPA